MVLPGRARTLIEPSLCPSKLLFILWVYSFDLHSTSSTHCPEREAKNGSGAGLCMIWRASMHDMRERVNPIFSSVLSQNSKLLVIAQLHPRSTEHLMSNIHLHNTIQHAFAALMQVQTPHLCMVILSRTSCTHHHHQRRRQWVIFAVPTETKLGSTTFRFGSEHQRKMSSIRGSMDDMEGVYA